eukprot:Lankesteria_metandrocarpae@DN4293_c0_g1_i6.p1
MLSSESDTSEDECSSSTSAQHISSPLNKPSATHLASDLIGSAITFPLSVWEIDGASVALRTVAGRKADRATTAAAKWVSNPCSRMSVRNKVRQRLAQDNTDLVTLNPANAAACIDLEINSEVELTLLRTLIAVSDLTLDALILTAAAIEHNPCDYTSWEWRKRCLLAANPTAADYAAEAAYIKIWVRRDLKNYQVWRHREWLAGLVGVPDNELRCLEKSLDLDLKNVHAWGYRKCLVDRGLSNRDTEFEFIDRVLKKDVWNHSAWSYRYYLLKQFEWPLSVEDVHRELRLAACVFDVTPGNESSWLYFEAFIADAFSEETKSNMLSWHDVPSDVVHVIERVAGEICCPDSRFARSALAKMNVARGNSAEAKKNTLCVVLGSRSTKGCVMSTTH